MLLDPLLNTRIKKTLQLVFILTLPVSTYAQSNNSCIASPDWGIFVTDYGYADAMVDLRTIGDLNFKGREYLSGEWGHAIAYTKAAVVNNPIWLEPDFLFPDWQTNSNFSVNSAITMTAVNTQGLPSYQSVISNSDLEITINSQVIDTATGIKQGMNAASAINTVEPPLNSGRYILQQTYVYKNISGETLSDITIFQMLHSLAALVALYDDRIYSDAASPAGPFGFDASHHYDSTLIAKDTETGSFIDPSPCLTTPVPLQLPSENVFHYDRLTMHTQTQPSHIDNFYFGDEGVGDNHIFGKPGIGTHINVEANNLNDFDFFDPGDIDYPNTPYFASNFGATTLGDLWVATAQQHELANLQDGQSASFIYLLSLKTDTIDLRPTASVPIPPPLLIILFLMLSICAHYRLKSD